MKKFATSENKYAMGIVYIDSDGLITWDPKSLGAESTVNLNRSLGQDLVDFEELLIELVDSAVKLTGAKSNNRMSQIE